MTTGAFLPLAVLSGRELPSWLADVGGVLGGEGFDRLAPGERSRKVGLLIRTALEAGASSRVEFQDAPGSPSRRPGRSPVPPQRPGQVGRNDPCPCGSGKKFKKCCGAR